MSFSPSPRTALHDFDLADLPFIPRARRLGRRHFSQVRPKRHGHAFAAGSQPRALCCPFRLSPSWMCRAMIIRYLLVICARCYRHMTHLQRKRPQPAFLPSFLRVRRHWIRIACDRLNSPRIEFNSPCPAMEMALGPNRKPCKTGGSNAGASGDVERRSGAFNGGPPCR